MGLKQILFLGILISISFQARSQSERMPVDTNVIYHEKIENHFNPINKTLNFYAMDEIESIDLIDTKGEVILKTSESEISMDDFMNGVYFYRVKFHGGKTAEGKFLKE